MYIVDTHAIIWFIEGNPNLSETAKNLMVNKPDEIMISCVSLWEIAIKISIRKLELEQPFEEIIKKVEELWNINYYPPPELFSFIEKLPFHKINGIEHRDPFDRMLIAQSLTTNIPIISCDEKFDLYPEINRIW